MLKTFTIAAVALAATLSAVPATARHHTYHHNGYSARQNYVACRADTRRAGHQGIASGAAAGGLGTAALGGNLGESLAGAAVGGVAGNFIGRGTPHRCSRTG